MAESGGTTTQSGIHYQNSIAALFIGRLLDSRQRIARDRVIEVRVEAPEHVDDIVVRHADGSRSFIQAKEALSSTSVAWEKLWIDFAAQAQECAGEQFRLVLTIGKNSTEMGHLRELCERAQGKKDHQEWLDSLSLGLKAISDKIVNSLPEKTDHAAFQLVRFVEVWIWPLETIERDMIPLWIPSSSVPQNTLFDLLLGKVGGKARIRGLFYAAELLEKLGTIDKVSVHDTPDWGIDAYRQTIRTEMGILSVPGTKLSGPIDDLFLWVPLRDRANDNARIDFEEEDPRWRWKQPVEAIDLRNFPCGTIMRAVIDAGAGFGKTTMLHAIACRLSSGIRIPALIPLDALAASNMTILGYLNDKVNTEYDVSIDWERLCESGRAVALLDGLDELSAAARTSVLNTIIKFAARFPQTAFLLTVRDSAALTVPLGVSTLALNRLDDFSISQFTEAYSRHGGSLSSDMLSNHLRRHPDLGHLLRIPLFLALVLASVGPDDDLPGSRSELLEHYLLLLFSPERHKAMAEPLAPMGDLRESAELLAWRGLEEDGIGLAEATARRFLRGQGLIGQPDDYLNRLVQIGVLRRVTARLQFAYPIVQEYLAACWMVHNSPKEIGPRFACISRRPWAQALQFALEMHPEAGPIIRNQLNAPDDAFYTTLRLIARCIVNGAKVTADLRNDIGDRLADAWSSESYSIRNSIGYLIADGFLDPLPAQAVSHISAWALTSGGAEIVAAKASPSLTREVLKSLLTRDMTFKFHLHDWQVVVDDIANEALDLYLERTRNSRTTEEELEALASLIAGLSPSRLSADRWQVATDHNLPPIIRLAGFRLSPRPVPSNAWATINEVLKMSELDDRYHYEYAAFKLFWLMQDAESRFIQMLNDTTASEKLVRSALEGLLKSDMDKDARRVFLRRVINDSRLSQDRRFLMFLCLAIWGDIEAECETINMLPNQNAVNVRAWLLHANKFSEKTVREAAKIIIGQQYSSNEILLLIGSADFGLSFKTDGISFESAAGIEPCINPIRKEMISSLITCLSDEDESFDALKVRAESGDIRDCERLAFELRTFLTNFQEDIPSDDDQKVSSALYILGQRMSLPFDLLYQIIDKSSSNAGRQAVDQLVRRGDEKIMLELLERYNLFQKKDFVREAIFSGLETLAGRYGKRIVRVRDKLSLEQG
jgi:hypothetical protein